jgi:hypothetical protein
LLGEVGPAETKNLPPGFGQCGVTLGIALASERVVMKGDAVDLDDVSVLRPVEIDLRAHRPEADLPVDDRPLDPAGDDLLQEQDLGLTATPHYILVPFTKHGAQASHTATAAMADNQPAELKEVKDLDSLSPLDQLLEAAWVENGG